MHYSLCITQVDVTENDCTLSDAPPPTYVQSFTIIFDTVMVNIHLLETQDGAGNQSLTIEINWKPFAPCETPLK